MMKTLPRWYTKMATEEVIAYHKAAMELKEVLIKSLVRTEGRKISVAECAFGKMMLAIGLYSESDKNLDISKVLLMILLYYFKNFTNAYNWFFNSANNVEITKESAYYGSLLKRRKNVFEYNRDLVKKGIISRKEWDFYTIFENNINKIKLF